MLSEYLKADKVDISTPPETEMPEVSSWSRKKGITLFGYFGLFVLGLFPLIKALLKFSESEPSETFFRLGLGLVYLILSYYLLKLRNWARISLIILNAVMAFFVVLVDLFVLLLTFSLMTKYIALFNGSKAAALVLLSSGYFALAVYNLHYIGFLIYFNNSSVKKQFKYVYFTQPSALLQSTEKRKLWPVILIICLGLAIFSGVLVFAGPSEAEISDIKMNTNPEQDPLSCALLVARKIKLESSEQNLLLKRIAAAYAEAGGYDQAIQIANSLSKDCDRAETLTEIACCCVEAGEKERASDVLSQALQAANMIQDDIIKSEKLERIAIKCAEIGQYDQSLQIANTINRAFNKVNAMAEIASTNSKAGKEDEAFGILIEALEATQQEDNPDVKNRNMAEIAVKYAEIGEYDQALQMANIIDRACYKAKALARIASNYAKTDNADKASELLLQAFEVIKKEDKNAVKNRNLVAIAVGHAEIDQYTEALRVVYTIKSANIRARLLGKIAADIKPEQTNKSNEILARALKEIKRMERGRSKFETPYFIVTRFAENGLYEQALRIAKSIKDTNYKAASFTKIAHSYAEAGNKDKAFETLLQASEIAVESDPRSVFVLGSAIACDYIKIGQKERACLILEKVLPLADTVDDETFKNQVLLDIISAYAEVGQYDEALQIAKNITVPTFKANAFVDIIIEYAQAGQKKDDSDINVLQKISDELKWYKKLFAFDFSSKKINVFQKDL